MCIPLRLPTRAIQDNVIVNEDTGRSADPFDIDSEYRGDVPRISLNAQGIELTLETAKELRAALDRAIAAADFDEAEVRGKGAVRSLVRAA